MGTCVAVCTHDRPDDLQHLLKALVPQVIAAKAHLVIIDNGQLTARDVVESSRGGASVIYRHIPEPGLVAVRNAALRACMDKRPEFIAFIDDDEVPDPGWLAALHSCLETAPADICCGPLRPRFDGLPPQWAETGGFFAKSGKHIGTGNMMFRASILPADKTKWFQPAFAHIGGEDEELFSRLISAGARFATAERAWVSERVPQERLNLHYVCRTGMRDGAIEVALMRQRGLSSISILSDSLQHCVKKMAYALGHLGMMWSGSWHAVAAMRDGAEIAGTIGSLVGHSAAHYGKPS